MPIGALGVNFGRLGVMPQAGTSTPAPPAGGPSLNFSIATSSMYIPLFAGFV